MHDDCTRKKFKEFETKLSDSKFSVHHHFLDPFDTAQWKITTETMSVERIGTGEKNENVITIDQFLKKLPNILNIKKFGL